MTKTAKTFFTAFMISIVLCIVTAGLIVYSCIYEYDPDIQHFSTSPTVYAMTGMLGVSLICSAGVFFAAGKKAFLDTSNEKTSFAETFTGILLSLLCLLQAILIMREGMPSEKAYIVCIRLALFFISGIYFALKALSEKIKKKRSAALLSVIPSLLFASEIISNYYNDDYALNAGILTISYLMFISFMLYFCFEIQIESSKPECTRKYLFAATFAVSAGGAVAISKLALSLISKAGFTSELLTGVFYTVLWLYVTVRFARRSAAATESTQQIAESEDNSYGMKPASEDTESEDAPPEKDPVPAPEESKSESVSIEEGKQIVSKEDITSEPKAKKIICDTVDEEDKDEFYDPSEEDI